MTSVYCFWLLWLTPDSCYWPLIPATVLCLLWLTSDLLLNPNSCYWPLTHATDLCLLWLTSNLLMTPDFTYWPLIPATDLWLQTSDSWFLLLTPVIDLLCCVTDLWLLLLTSDSCSSFPTSISKSSLSCPSFSSSLFSSLWANWNCTKIKNNIKYPIMGESLKVKVCINRKCNEMTFLLPSCLPFISTECH